MASKVPKITLNNGLEVPVLGLGTWKSEPKQVISAVKAAIDVGYRHFDCAHFYQNEKEVGNAINAKIKEGIVKREDLWITSKLWNTFHRPELVEGALRTTLANLGLEYLDLYLMHSPMAFKEGRELLPSDDGGKTLLFSDVDYVETYKAMEKTVKLGLTRSIGLSNFNSEQIKRVLTAATIKPVINQVECHPYLNQKKLQAFCKERGIVLTAYSPLGTPDRPRDKPDDPKVLDDPKVANIADRYKKSPAQVVLRYQIQMGNIAIPKSVTERRIKENFDVFDFELSAEDMKILDSLERNGRICFSTQRESHPYYPFHIPY